MKTFNKYICLFSSWVAVGTMGFFSSCEDMLFPESDLVMYEEDNNLNSVNDTLYSVMGVVRLMQNVADRTNLLGEVRGDLVTLTDDATTALREIAEFNAGVDNIYNAPQDYYAIINNCNYFINTADTAYSKRGQKVFEREMVAIKGFRAWTYLQLALNYGEVPFYTHFINTKEEGERVLAGPKKDLLYICNYFIEDLAPYVNVLPLDYGSVGGFPSSKFFIPLRVLLGDLSLWSGRYEEAAQYYHDYVADLDNPLPIGVSSVSWRPTVPADLILDSWSVGFTSASSGVLSIVPMESSAFNGKISELEDVYNSTEDNYYFYQVTRSAALSELSYNQDYDYLYVENNKRDTICLKDSTYTNPLMHGDLRLYATYHENPSNNSGSSIYNTSYQTISKHFSDFVCLDRLSRVYLRYAEALNRAGYPSAAFAILKYGLCQENNRMYIAPQELEKAGTLLSFNQFSFTKDNVLGIHARGCGDAFYSPHYVLPLPADSLDTYADTIAYQIPLVEDLIIAESALESAFEGVRYYDLMRVALRRDDTDYLAKRVASRNGSDSFDETIYSKLQNRNNWYLPLP